MAAAVTLGQSSLHIILRGACIIQHSQQFVWWSEAASLQVRRREIGEGLELLRRVGPQIDFSALHAGVTEPKRYLANVTRRLKGVHCAGVPENVRRHPLLGDRRLFRRRSGNMLSQDLFETGSGHCPP